MAKGGPSAGSVVYSDVRQALASELEARRQLTRLQREMRQIERNEVMEANRSARAAAGVALRRDIDVRVGRDLTEKYKTVPYASEEEMVRLGSRAWKGPTVEMLTEQHKQAEAAAKNTARKMSKLGVRKPGA